MSSPHIYRIYCYDAALKAVSSDWLEATRDEDAIAEAETRGFGTKCEIWDGARLVAKLGSTERQFATANHYDPPFGRPMTA